MDKSVLIVLAVLFLVPSVFAENCTTAATCNSPPASACDSSGTQRIYYLPSGTCNSGSCNYSSTATDCPYGCLNGMCQRPSSVTGSFNCGETDNGLDYYNKGQITYSVGIYTLTLTDICTSSVLNEYYCDSDLTPQSVFFQCPSGCGSGACLISRCIPGETDNSTCLDGRQYKKSECVSGVWKNVTYASDPCLFNATAADGEKTPFAECTQGIMNTGLMPVFRMVLQLFTSRPC